MEFEPQVSCHRAFEMVHMLDKNTKEVHEHPVRYANAGRVEIISAHAHVLMKSHEVSEMCLREGRCSKHSDTRNKCPQPCSPYPSALKIHVAFCEIACFEDTVGLA